MNEHELTLEILDRCPEFSVEKARALAKGLKEAAAGKLRKPVVELDELIKLHGKVV